MHHLSVRLVTLYDFLHKPLNKTPYTIIDTKTMENEDACIYCGHLPSVAPYCPKKAGMKHPIPSVGPSVIVTPAPRGVKREGSKLGPSQKVITILDDHEIESREPGSVLSKKEKQRMREKVQGAMQTGRKKLHMKHISKSKYLIGSHERQLRPVQLWISQDDILSMQDNGGRQNWNFDPYRTIDDLNGFFRRIGKNAPAWKRKGYLADPDELPWFGYSKTAKDKPTVLVQTDQEEYTGINEKDFILKVEEDLKNVKPPVSNPFFSVVLPVKALDVSDDSDDIPVRVIKKQKSAADGIPEALNYRASIIKREPMVKKEKKVKEEVKEEEYEHEPEQEQKPDIFDMSPVTPSQDLYNDDDAREEVEEVEEVENVSRLPKRKGRGKNKHRVNSDLPHQRK